MKEQRCQYYNTGFCKYMNRCKFKHPNINCPKVSCKDRSCENRHPKHCRYKDQCRRQTSCLYLHKIHVVESLELDILRAEIKMLEDSNNHKINLLVKVHLKEINDLEKRLKKVEAENKSLNDMIKSMDENVSECSESDASYNDEEDDLGYSCAYCQETFKTSAALTIHKTIYPVFCFKCEVCLNGTTRKEQLFNCIEGVHGIGAYFNHETVEDPEWWMIFTADCDGGIDMF